jgi:hypothetical protein
MAAPRGLMKKHSSPRSKKRWRHRKTKQFAAASLPAHAGGKVGVIFPQPVFLPDRLRSFFIRQQMRCILRQTWQHTPQHTLHKIRLERA